MPDVNTGSIRAAATWLLTLSLITPSACEDFRECEVVGSPVTLLPESLSQTGLYEDLERGTLARGVRRFSPQFALWSDGAEKQRFVALPDGAQIDTRDMNDWQFPVGTRLWKQFVRDGVRVETRLEQKTGPAPPDWALAAYIWNDDESDAHLAFDGQANARQTEHDVPRAADCWACHGGRKSRVLGFSAVQLTAAAAEGELDLRELMETDRLTVNPQREPQVPGTAVQVAGLGYLHANCSHCHNRSRPDSDGPRCYDPNHSFDFVLRVDELREVSATATSRTARDSVIEPGNPNGSQVIQRMRVRDPQLPSMPPLATELVDRTGLAAVRALIDSL